MKRKYFLQLIVLCLLAAGCKKESGKKEYCRITKLLKNGNQEIDIKYGDNEKISSIENIVTKEVSSYKYLKDTVFITATKSGNLLYKLVVTNNKNHFATNVRMELGPNEWINQAFTYEGNRVVSNKATNSDGFSETVSYIWKNGNIDVLVNDGEIIKYEYYTDKNFQEGDFRAIQQLLTGYRIYEYKNLVKSSGSPDPSTYFTYLFDDTGRVTEVTATTTNISTSYQIEYDCN